MQSDHLEARYLRILIWLHLQRHLCLRFSFARCNELFIIFILLFTITRILSWFRIRRYIKVLMFLLFIGFWLGFWLLGIPLVLLFGHLFFIFFTLLIFFILWWRLTSYSFFVTSFLLLNCWLFRFLFFFESVEDVHFKLFLHALAGSFGWWFLLLWWLFTLA